MKQSFKILAVETKVNGVNPVIVFELEGAQAIVRRPKQALIDLQNSGRCLNVPRTALDNGIKDMHPEHYRTFITDLKECTGAILTGDITFIKAGEKYPVRAGHPALVNPNHPAYGVKEGDFLVAQKGTSYVEGFLDIPLTAVERLQNKLINSSAGTNALLAMFGVTSTESFAVVAETPAPAPISVPTLSPEKAVAEYDEQDFPEPAGKTASKPAVKTAMDAAIGK